MTNSPQTFDGSSGGPAAGKPARSEVALASLILGVVGCVPLASLVAVVLGIMGISATKGGKKSGRGFAVFGIILGMLGLIGWSCAGMSYWGVWSLYSAYSEPAAVTRGFMEDLSEGRLTAAQEKTQGLPNDVVEAMSKYVKEQGGFRDFTGDHWTVHDGVSELRGTVNFGKKSEKLEADLKQIGGKWKLTRITIVDNDAEVPK